MRHSTVILLLLLLSGKVFGQHFTMTEDCRSAYSQLLDLEFAKADRKLQQIRSADPKNLMPLYLEDVRDFLLIVVTEDEAEFEKRKDLRSERLKQFENAPESPYKRLAIGETHLHWAFSMIRFGEYLSGAREINRAFRSLEENTKKYPDFLPTYKGMGLLHTLIGTVPDNYKWATKLMGVDGTIETGIAEMESVVSRSKGNIQHKELRKETLFLLSFLHINLLNDPAALDRISNDLKPESGPLMDFAKASMAKKNGRSDDAISILTSSTAQRPNAFPYLSYLLGELKLSRMDKDANVPLEQYVNTFKGKSYLKAAKQKLAWHALLITKNTPTYRMWMKRVLENGSSMLDEDKSAQDEAESGQLPNVVLLKARLQFDGGYYLQALETLINSDRKAIAKEDEELEFTYRLGRIYHEWGKYQEAIPYYLMTIEKGKHSKRYFAANSSLQLGLIYERLGKKNQALASFNACDDFDNTEYRNSIIQKAKAGIGRLTK